MLSLLSLVATVAGIPVLGNPSIPQSIPESDWRTEDFVTSEAADEFVISPDSRRIAWIKSFQDEKKQDQKELLFLTEISSGETIQLTRNSIKASSPKWSPDGKFLSFLTDASDDQEGEDKVEGAQLWRLDLRGGEAKKISSAPRGVRSYAWRDASRIVFTSEEDKSAYERKKEDGKDTTVVTEDAENEPPVRLFELTVEDGKIRRLTDNRDWISGLTLSHDGNWAVTQHTQSLRAGWDQDKPSKFFLRDLRTGSSREIVSNEKLRAENLVFSLNDKQIFFLHSYTTHPRYLLGSVNQLYVLSVEDAAKTAQLIDLKWDRGARGALAPTSRGIVVALEDGVSPKLAHYIPESSTWRREWTGGAIKGAGNIGPFALAKDGKTAVFIASSTELPPQIYRASFGATTRSANPEPVWGEVKALTELNPAFKSRKIAKTEIVRWKGALGEEVEGLLTYPRNYVAGKRHPLILAIHGGPHYADTDEWAEGGPYVPNLYAQKDAFTLRPNYHGSSSYGLKFSESIQDGLYYKLPVEDLQKGVQFLIDKGLADPSQLGTVGWSNGAILSAALIAETPGQFKVAYLGAGGIDWTADWAVCGFGKAFDEYYIGGSPIKNPERYREVSYLSKFDKVTTPSIIFCGTEDTAVPIHHSWMQYRILQDAGKAPVRFLQFPGEPHGLRKPSHVRRCFEEGVAWIERYLLNPGAVAEAGLAKEGSPLFELKKLLKVARTSGGLVGVASGDLILPEVVEHEGLKVGRFEVTRAQYAASLGRPAPLADGNLPVTGVSLAEAKAYCEWLSKKTGRKFRLPNATEAQKLYQERGGNTLDYWFGIPVSHVDVDRLTKELALLPTEHLLKPVGSFTGAGEVPVFDLDGNAAEWLDDGSIAGGSVDSPADSKSPKISPAPRFIGFRVLEG